MRQEDVGANLKRRLRLRSGKKNILSNRESSSLEFKRSFSLGSTAAYARTMAAFANNEGGYIVFGVKPQPHELAGLNKDNFESVDPARVSGFLNDHLSPELEWEMGTIKAFGYELGFVYTQKSLEKPIIVTANAGKDLKEGVVYYRYRGQSTAIKYAELRKILECRFNRERRAWIQHLKAISRTGPLNVAVIDTIQGKVFGGSTPFLIDEKLLRQLKFVREGSFSQATGAPTLRLVGELRSMSGVTSERIVHRGIHYGDLVTAFLAQRQLDPSDAATYLRETCHQTSHYIPLFYFMSAAKLTKDEAIQLLQSENTSFIAIRRRLINRIRGSQVIKPSGAVKAKLPKVKGIGLEELKTELAQGRTLHEKRSFLLAVLNQNPELLADAEAVIPINLLLQAITHLKRPTLEKHRETIFGMLLSFFSIRFASSTDLAKTSFRRTVGCLDQLLYS